MPEMSRFCALKMSRSYIFIKKNKIICHVYSQKNARKKGGGLCHSISVVTDHQVAAHDFFKRLRYDDKFLVELVKIRAFD